MMIICIDTNVISDATSQPKPSEPIRVQRQRDAMMMLALAFGDPKVELVMPAPVVAEVLCWFDDDGRRRQFVERFKHNDFIWPLETESAEWAARLVQKLLAAHPTKYPKTEREMVRTDCFIAAIALRRRCDYLCSSDNGMRSIEAELEGLNMGTFEVKTPREMLVLLEPQPSIPGTVPVFPGREEE